MNKVLFDPIRKKNVAATPEENVRQAVLKYLTESLGVPGRLIAVEYSLTHFAKGKLHRADVMVWTPERNAEGGLQPWLLVECKAPGIDLNKSLEHQISLYLRYFPSPYLMLTNGAQSLYFKLDRGRGYEPLYSLPYFPNKVQ